MGKRHRRETKATDSLFVSVVPASLLDRPRSACIEDPSSRGGGQLPARKFTVLMNNVLYGACV